MPSLQLPAAQTPAGPVASLGPRLTLADAERMAIEHNPNISVARLIALAQAQVTREVRSAELPTAQGSLTAVGAHENSRITAGLLNNPSVYDRAAGGLTVSQLITDFGRTHNLVRSAQSNAEGGTRKRACHGTRHHADSGSGVLSSVDEPGGAEGGGGNGKPAPGDGGPGWLSRQGKAAVGSRSELCECATLTGQTAFA